MNARFLPFTIFPHLPRPLNCFFTKELSATLETIHKTCRISINHLPEVCGCSMTYDLYSKRKIKTWLMED